MFTLIFLIGLLAVIAVVACAQCSQWSRTKFVVSNHSRSSRRRWKHQHGYVAPLAYQLAAPALFALAALEGWWNRVRGIEPGIALANIAEGTHADAVFSKKADGALSRYRLLKQGTDADHVDHCGAGDCPIGNSEDEAGAAEDRVHVRMLGPSKGTVLMVASEAIDVDEYVYTAANGKVQDEPGNAGTYYLVGKARSAAAADGDLLEVQPCFPIKVVVLAAQTSTNGTAAAAADLDALKAETEKIGDDVRAIRTATNGGPCLIKIL